MGIALNSILVVGSKRMGALELAYVRAFKRVGSHPVEHFDLEAPARYLTRYRVLYRVSQPIQEELTGRAFFRYLKANEAEHSAVIVFKGMPLNPRWLSQCKSLKPRSTWVNLNPDDPFNLASRGASNRNIYSSIPLYDVYATWGRHLIPHLERAGAKNVIYLPFAYDADTHFPSERLDSNLANQITFVGTWDRQREQVLSAVADLPIKVFGNFWDRVDRRSPLRDKVYPSNLYGADLRRVISSSLASINILRPQNLNSHNMRTFETPAMRGLMITSASQEQNAFFPDGKACLMFTDVRDLHCKLEHVTRSSDRERLKNTGFGLCRGHSYDDRAEWLCDFIARYRRSGAVA